MKDGTKRFLVSGVMVLGLFLFVGGLWVAINAEAPVWKKVILLGWASAAIIFMAKYFYNVVIKTGEWNMTHGVFCDLDSLFVDGNPRKDYFNEIVTGFTSRDIIFFTKKEVAKRKNMLAHFTSKSYPVISLDKLKNKKLEVVIGAISLTELNSLGISCKYYIVFAEKGGGKLMR